MEQFFSVLLQCPLFVSIEEADYAGLLSCINAYTKTFHNEEYILFSGDEVSHVGIVLSGSLEILKENPAGTKHILAFLSPANIFGEGIVCTHNRISPVTVKAKESTIILFIPYERIIKSCSSSCSFHNQLIKNMVMLLGEKNLILNQKIELLTLKGMREKLATYLLTESQRQAGLTFQIIPNRNELAEYLNVSRTSMCRELARMKELQMIDYYQNSFKILSVNLLKECLLNE